ncbi:MAG: bifunctional riboflavin kinase/FAD synthetase [Lachnospiraceae bacterium]|nr:bifunctional riboflavin kinase/FAD synthetase [Lachnospiraceae bacterium]
MEIQRGLSLHMENSALSLGKFDAIHRGHRLLLKEILQPGNGVPTVFTFERNPGETERYIYSQQEKNHLLQDLGVVREVLFPFDEETKSMLPEKFIDEILWKKMDVRFICVGEDFRFGRNREGDVELLRRACEKHGCRLKVYNKLADERGIISSTRIRNLLQGGDVEKANALLGTPFFFLGEVVHGEALGRSLQIPTANLIPAPEKILPQLGVYTSRITVQGKRYGGVTNIGKKPTVGGTRVGVETSIFDFDREIYGEEIKVELLKFQRPEQKFPDMEALRTQMEKDLTDAKNYMEHCLL